jgi:hypothetical protein
MAEPMNAGARTVSLRPARAEEGDLLTDLAFRSKAYWGYDEAFMAACRDELVMRASEVVSLSMLTRTPNRSIWPWAPSGSASPRRVQSPGGNYRCWKFPWPDPTSAFHRAGSRRLIEGCTVTAAIP